MTTEIIDSQQQHRQLKSEIVSDWAMGRVTAVENIGELGKRPKTCLMRWLLRSLVHHRAIDFRGDEGLKRSNNLYNFPQECIWTKMHFEKIIGSTANELELTKTSECW